MKTRFSEKPKLFAFDLDGTLLNSQKKLSRKNLHALEEMVESGAVIVFASGRLGSSIGQYVQQFPFPISILSLNGAAVYLDQEHNSRCIYQVSLQAEFANYLITYAHNKPFALNYYFNNKLYAVQSETAKPWQDLYFNQTNTTYNFVDSLQSFSTKDPSKIIFVGPQEIINQQQLYFSKLWGNKVYICRTWDYYLEFLNPGANKGSGLKAIADAYSISMKSVVAFGDASNDIPMLENVGLGIALKNATNDVKAVADHISEWSNDEDAIAHEWDQIKNYL